MGYTSKYDTLLLYSLKTENRINIDQNYKSGDVWSEEFPIVSVKLFYWLEYFIQKNRTSLRDRSQFVAICVVCLTGLSVFINRGYCWVAREALNKTKNGWPHPQHMDIMVHTSKVSWINYFSNRQLPLHKYEYEHLHLNNSSRTRSGRLSLVWKLHFPPHSNNHSSNWDQYLDLELLIPTKGGSQNRADKSDRKKIMVYIAWWSSVIWAYECYMGQ